jgi:pyruvate/oxaloacetate carboxyltransferase
LAEETPINDRQAKYHKQIRQKMEELDEIVQEFSRREGAQKYEGGNQTNREFQPRESNTSNRTNEVLMETMRETKGKNEPEGFVVERRHSMITRGMDEVL